MRECRHPRGSQIVYSALDIAPNMYGDKLLAITWPTVCSAMLVSATESGSYSLAATDPVAVLVPAGGRDKRCT